MCAEDAAFISDSEAFGLKKRTKIFLCSLFLNSKLLLSHNSLICTWFVLHTISLDLWRRMTERNILLLKSAMSAAKSMSPLKHKNYEKAFREICDGTKETNIWWNVSTWWEQCGSHLDASQQTCEIIFLLGLGYGLAAENQQKLFKYNVSEFLFPDLIYFSVFSFPHHLLINCFSLSSAAFFRFEPTWRISTWALSRSSRTTLCSLAIT